MPEDDESDEEDGEDSESAHRRRLQPRSNGARLGRVCQHVRVHGTHRHWRRRQKMEGVMVTRHADVCLDDEGTEFEKKGRFIECLDNH